MSSQEEAPRIALFGGTFDPVHQGHIEVAAQAVRVLGLRRVIFLPCRQSPHKEAKAGATEEQRLEMLRLATADFEWAEVDDWEFHQPQPSYSWRTAEVFKEKFPEASLYWLMGWDQWKVITTWGRWEYFRELVELIVHDRAEEGVVQDDPRVTFIAGEHSASSSEIRERLSQNQRIPENWLHEEVLSLLTNGEVYR